MAGEAKKRLFIGIPLSADIRAYAERVIGSLQGKLSDIRWVPAQNLHVTIKFLGLCEDSKVGEIIEVMKAAGVYLPLRLEVGGVGAFPSLAYARVIWMSVKDCSGEIEKMYRVIDKGVGRLGIPREKRKYHPHITIGRARGKHACVPENVVKEYPDRKVLNADEVVLFESKLSREGAKYTVIESISSGEGARNG
ncbi:MAG: RNA 2',3'-cyclic phosphodiesterase [Actinomycetota bacterium]|nr:RNA 2',3'-cyclic phosphodiesterase [Actinomycetota bacterium]